MQQWWRACPIVMLFAFCLLQPSLTQGAEARKHPIDRMQEECMEKDWSTAGMANCTYKAEALWDKELNRNYQALMKRLSPGDRELLKDAQRRWLEFREREFKLIDAFYAKLQGTMYIPMRASEMKQLVRQRALDLAGYLELAAGMEKGAE